jgi:LDH2 family malate/lactate/ureidoglycolate dehydrogenase
MVVDIMAGILSGRGAAYLGGNRGQGIFQIALKISAFRDVVEFKREMDDLIRAVRGCRPAPGFKEVLVPGDVELRTKKARLENGIDIPQTTWDELVETAKKVGVEVKTHLK